MRIRPITSGELVGFVALTLHPEHGQPIREYLERTGYKVGFKPAGGIAKAKQAMAWQSLMKEELGDEWLMPDLFRFGASTLLTDLERQLYHFITGHYAAKHHMPMG